MKDAKGHGSNGRGTYKAFTAAITPAHQRGVMQATARTPEEHIQAGGRLPTEAEHAQLVERNSAWIAGWGPSPSDQGKLAVQRLQDEIDRAKANREKFGSEDKPSAYTLKLRGKK